MKKAIKVLGILIVAFLCVVHLLPSVQRFSSVPDEIYLRKGTSRTLELGLPLQADVNSAGVVNISSETLEDATGERALRIESLESGERRFLSRCSACRSKP